jgi:hypothetical protein
MSEDNDATEELLLPKPGTKSLRNAALYRIRKSHRPKLLLFQYVRFPKTAEEASANLNDEMGLSALVILPGKSPGKNTEPRTISGNSLYILAEGRLIAAECFPPCLGKLQEEDAFLGSAPELASSFL